MFIFHKHGIRCGGISISKTLKEFFKEKYLRIETNTPVDRYFDNDIKVISSHTAPLMDKHQIGDDYLLQFYFYRHPIDRLYSWYNYERLVDLPFDHLKLAKSVSFKQYILTKLDLKTLENNYSSRIISGISPENLIIYDLEEIDLALNHLEISIKHGFPAFKSVKYWENQTNRENMNLFQRLHYIKMKLGDNLYNHLLELNSKDLEIITHISL